MSQWFSNSFKWTGGAIVETVDDAMQKALMECAEDLRTKSQAEVPVDTGALKESCTIFFGDIKSGVVKVGYNDLPYSLRQHEELGYNHPNGGKAKFLEDPFNANSQEYIDKLGVAVFMGLSKESFAK